MKSIDEARLDSDIHYRYQYLIEFIGFTAEDAVAIGRLHSPLQSIIPRIVQATYDKLLSFDATARHFLPRQHGMAEHVTPGSLASLTADHEHVKFRKEHLKRYLMILLANPYDAQMVKYLDMVGKIHTPAAGNKSIHIPLVQMNALMGLLSHLLMTAIQELRLESSIERQSMAAFNKLLWIQNDFIQRHYVQPVGTGSDVSASSVPASNPASSRSGWR